MIYFIALIFIGTSGYFITKMPLSPIYFGMFLSLYLFIIYILYKGKITINKIFLFPFIYIVYLFLSQLNRGELNTTTVTIISISYFILSYMILNNLTTKRILFVSTTMIKISLPLLLVEAYYRITNPIFVDAKGFDFRDSEDLFFYPYKFNSIMYQDSNFVGLYLVVLFFFIYYLEKYHGQILKIEKIIIVLLLFMTLSRAAIISVLFFSLFYYFWYKSKYLIRMFIVALSILFLIIVLFLFSNDGSLQTKFYLISLVSNFIQSSSMSDILLGIGFGNTKLLYGYGAHNLFLTHFIESGLIGLIFLVSFFLIITIKTHYKGLIVLLPFLMTSMSLAGSGLTYLFAVLTIIILLEKKEKNEQFKYKTCISVNTTL